MTSFLFLSYDSQNIGCHGARSVNARVPTLLGSKFCYEITFHTALYQLKDLAYSIIPNLIQPLFLLEFFELY